jgi:hypothetical protein
MLKPIQSFFAETPDSLLETPVTPSQISQEFFGVFDLNNLSNRPIIYWKESPKDVNLPTHLNYNNTSAMNRTIQIVKQSINGINEDSVPVKPGFIDSMMMRYLFNYTGDLHNPIRNATFFSKNLFNGDVIDGDDNGKKIPVNDVFKKGIDNLLDLYDNAFDIFDIKPLSLPYSTETKELIQNQGEYLMDKYPESSFGQSVDNLNIFDWGLESFDIADEFTYSEIEMLPIISPSYIIRGRRICEERITLAGYRLYKLLVKLFDKK